MHSSTLCIRPKVYTRSTMFPLYTTRTTMGSHATPVCTPCRGSDGNSTNWTRFTGGTEKPPGDEQQRRITVRPTDRRRPNPTLTCSNQTQLNTTHPNYYGGAQLLGLNFALSFFLSFVKKKKKSKNETKREKNRQNVSLPYMCCCILLHIELE